VNEVTEAAVDPADELPVDDCKPVVVTPLTSKIEMVPAVVALNAAVTVSAPALAAVAYQM
jgi:hypothetical protein